MSGAILSLHCKILLESLELLKSKTDFRYRLYFG